MRVLHVVNSLSSGGAERLVVDLVNAQRRVGIEADVLALTDKAAVYGVRDFVSGVRYSVHRPGASPYSPLHCLGLRKRFEGYDVLHVHLFPSQFWVGMTARERGRLLTTEHSTFNGRRRITALRLLDRMILARYRSVVSISPETAESLRDWLGMHEIESTVIENGVDLDRFRNAFPLERKSLSPSIRGDDVLVVMVARFTEMKDHATVVSALARLPTHYKLLLVGEGETLEATRRSARELGLESRVFFAGFRRDIERILRTADVAVLVSKWEGFGLAAVEAMAAGVPLIGSDVPGLARVVKGAGQLVSAGDADALAHTIRRTFELSPDEREQLIANQYQRAAAYSMERTASAYCSEYERIAGYGSGKA